MSLNDYEDRKSENQIVPPEESHPEKRSDKPVTVKTGRERRSGSFFDWFNVLSKNMRVLIICAAILVVAGIGYAIWQGTMAIFANREGEVVTSLRSALERIEEHSSLSTLEYTYNSVVPVYKDGNEEGDPRYFVYYQGKVTTGIDLKKVKVEPDSEDEGKIVVRIPPVEVQDTNVDVGSLKFIFKDKKAKTEDVVAKEAYGLCKKQLDQSAKEDTSLLAISKENVETELKALIDPVKNQLLKELEVSYEWQGN